jgi:N-hydroxyarylamine O-acetyltransferase
MSDEINLEAYFQRIGYDGPREATLETLKALHLKHPIAIPFENLNPIMGLPVPIDLPSIEAKLIRAGRGGYCFEQNALFWAVLRQLGFKTTGLAARVLRGGRPAAQSPRSHMLLRIELVEGVHIADIGFGSTTLTAPLRLFDEAPQQTPHGLFRVVKKGEEYEEQAEFDGEWQPQYRFALQEYYRQDYESLNWYRATHPKSPFVNILQVARALPEKRLGLRDNQYAIRYLDGRSEKTVLETPHEIMDVLANDFEIKLPEPLAGLESALSRIMRDSAS